MYSIEAVVSKTDMARLRKLYKTDLAAKARQFLASDLKSQAQEDARRELSRQPRQSPLPFIWSNDPVKQARARGWYFANKVPKGRGKRKRRYVRTGKLVAGWKVLFDARSGKLILRNDARGVEYVQGYKQVPSHARTRWRRADKVAPQVAARTEKRLIAFITKVSKSL